ncbi:MAG: outer membrane lipoprotein carrier protein LolA [Rhodospirillales bacterium]|nr:outer membrane lipoprotein carrier protein LolA [Rhodospirillales bacterium]
MMKMRLLALLAAALLAASPAYAGPKAKPTALSDSQKDSVAKAEAYLNDIRTLKARFLQSAPDGGIAEGTFYLSRPGKLRLEYDPPTPLLIIGAYQLLVYHDTQLKQTTQVPISSTPAGVLVQPKINLQGADLTVTGFSDREGLDRITIVQTDDPQAGSITLIFTREPYQLRQWIVKDPQGQMTTVTLSDARSGLAIDPKLFVFNDPNSRPAGFPNLQ